MEFEHAQGGLDSPLGGVDADGGSGVGGIEEGSGFGDDAGIERPGVDFVLVALEGGVVGFLFEFDGEVGGEELT